MWNYTGWDSLGTFAAEVSNSSKTYPRAVGITLLLNSVIFILPIMVGLSVYPDFTQWKSGFHITIAAYFAPWLAVAVMIGAVLSSAGQFNAQMSATSRALWAMGIDELRADSNRKQDPIVCDDTPLLQPKNPSKSTNKLPIIFAHSNSRYQTPDVAILFQGLVTCVLMLFHFENLIQIDAFLNCICLLFEFAAFIWLKYKESDTVRQYSVPGGLLGAWLLTLPKVFLIGATMLTSRFYTIIICILLNCVFCFAYILRTYCCFNFSRK